SRKRRIAAGSGLDVRIHGDSADVIGTCMAMGSKPTSTSRSLHLELLGPGWPAAEMRLHLVIQLP
ncbi:MAG: hypothetical protein MI919_14180, partial [Holophagales bacterium]|nr:hypothetical protein [Holophagales bacterium]